MRRLLCLHRHLLTIVALGSCGDGAAVLAFEDSVPPTTGSTAERSASSDASSGAEGLLPLDASRTPAHGGHEGGAMLDASAARLDASSAGALSARAPEYVQSLAEHACLHARNGPFRDLTVATPAAAPPDVSRAHTAYRLHASGAPLTVAFTAPEASKYVLFASEAASAITTAPGAPVAHYDARDGCELLPTATLFGLRSGDRMEIAYASIGSVLLVLERVATEPDAHVDDPDAAPSLDTAADAATMCRSSGPCSSNSECCAYCHDHDHCH